MITEFVIEHAEARRAVDIICTEILRRRKKGVVAVCDPHGDLIAFARMDGAPLSSITIAMNKAYSAARERKPTKEIATLRAIPRRASTSAILAIPGSRAGAGECRSGKTAASSERLP
jgi:glc operon protein GlcG